MYYTIDMKQGKELHPNSFNSGNKTSWTWKARPGLMPIELEPSSWKAPAPWNRTAERFDVFLLVGKVYIYVCIYIYIIVYIYTHNHIYII